MARQHHRPPRLPTKTVAIRLSDDAIARAEALLAKVPSLTSLSRILGRAVELGLEAVERELAGAGQERPVKPRNGDGRADVGTGAEGSL